MTTIAAPDSPSHGRNAICRMYTDVQASGSIQVVLSLISTAGTRCCCASASAEITAASASTTVGVNPDRRTRQMKKADHKHSAVSAALSHQPEICFVAASTATAVNKTAPPRRRAIAYQPASRCRAWSDGPANSARRARLRRPAGGRICPPTESAAGSTGPVCGRTTAPGTVTAYQHGCLRPTAARVAAGRPATRGRGDRRTTVSRALPRRLVLNEHTTSHELPPRERCSRLGLAWGNGVWLEGCPQVKRCVPTFVLAG